MKKKHLIVAVSAIVLLVAGLLLKSNSDSKQSILLNQNIESLANGDIYYLSECRMGFYGDYDKCEYDYFCDPNTIPSSDYYDCLGDESLMVPEASSYSKCIGKVDKRH